MRRLGIIIGALALVCLLFTAGGHGGGSPIQKTTPTTTSHRLSLIPRGLSPGCGGGADATSGLESIFNSRPSNSSVTLPHNACYTVNGILQIANTTGLTINGNGATFNQTVAGPESAPVKPILLLTQDTNLKISNLTIDGDNTGSNGGDFYEGDFGVMLEADTGVLLTGMTVENIQGDCLLVQAPNPLPSGTISLTSSALNTNVTMTRSTLDMCGYHGITLEGGDGFTFSYNKVIDVGLDAMDFEVDGDSTTIENGTPYLVAEDNIKILNNVWTNFGADWYASLQDTNGAGVQQQHVTLSGNTLNSSSYGGSPSSYIDIWGTMPYVTTTPYLNIWLTITNNKSRYALGKPFDEPNSYYSMQSGNVAIALDSVSGVTVTHNVFPVAGEAAIVSYENYGLNVSNNSFLGASEVFDTSEYGYAHQGASFVTQCGNVYGSGSIDAAC